MPARSIPRPAGGTATSRLQLHAWLRYLCINATCRGLGGHELLDAEPLVGLGCLVAQDELAVPEVRAHRLRALVRAEYLPLDGHRLGGDPQAAKLHLLGLSAEGFVQPRAERRRLAAEAMGTPLDTFQKRAENDLLHDVAADLWRLESESHHRGERELTHGRSESA